MAIRTFQYRLCPTQAQEQALQVLLDVSRNVYNMALEERKLAWEHEKKLIGKCEGYLLAKQYKKIFPQAKTCRIIRKAGKWFVNLVCQTADPVPLPPTGRIVGIDMGMNALITASDGDQVHNLRWYSEAQTELRRKQRKGWGYFKRRLFNKAADAGRMVILVDPAYTSKHCSNCGAIFEDLTLVQRWVVCDCGLSLDRDHNATPNILKRAGRVREPERCEQSQAWFRIPCL